MRMQDIRKEHNFRELGGYVTENGRIVRHGQFYRSGPLGKMSAEELAYIERQINIGELEHVTDWSDLSADMVEQKDGTEI